MAKRKSTIRRMVMAPAFVVLVSTAAGAALAPSINQNPVVGALLFGGAVFLVQTML